MMNLCKEELFLFINAYYGFILVAVVSLGVTVLLVSKDVRLRERRDISIPGQLGLPFFGEIFSFLSASNSTKGTYEFVRLRRLWYGLWFKTRILGKIHVFVPSTEGAKRILTNEFGLFKKEFVKPMGDFVGKKSLFSAPAESHKRIRRLLSDPFSMNSLHRFVEEFDNMLVQRLKKLEENGKSFSMLEFCMKLTFDAICNMLMGIMDENLLRQIDRDSKCVSDALLSFPLMIPGTRYYKGIKARDRLMERFREIIDRRRSGMECQDDFLQSMLSRDSYPSDEKLDDSEIMDNILTMLLAGQTTTAATLMWCVKFLDDNREVQDKLREEQLHISQNKARGYSLSMEDVKSMSYGVKVVKETLRMANVVLWYPRVALEDCTIEGFEIKKGWRLNIDASYIHYDPELYKDPTQFNPLRFDEIQKPYSLIPFGSGPRTCIGMNLAKVAMLVFLHRLTTGYRWTVDDPDPSLEKKAFVPRLRSGLPVTLKPLEGGR
ncbi:abscisic acid 8'-hydroxylase 3-like [Tripterygium wilfordii]|uniref:Abscisic acid 8'-hydroxylase 3-like n=1 Tax=Tripterygium wilfordii TaxID=458696 RepID=A0A7J7CPW0_TRIWF|nr:abscisic acid 8'-hydroxylase 3-like [Tripterygium wilfordii]KAF5736009.1 abscisic acid 8'-hydroxylase 3-like [Tripterygium wilfordii]